MAREILLSDKDEVRFWMTVRSSKDSCWLWMGYKDKDGYGQFAIWIDGKRFSLRPHRVSWALHRGQIPDGLFVCHQCDNPACVRPDHLFIGTNRDNMIDCIVKGRFGRAKLTDKQVQKIRSLYAVGNVTQEQLGTMFCMHQSYVSRIINNKRWEHLP